MKRAKTLLARAMTVPLTVSMLLGSVPVSAGTVQETKAAAGSTLDTSYIFANLGAEKMPDSKLSFDGSNFGKATADGNNVTFSGTVINAGNGNGFKMGGSGMSGKHTLKNSVAYENKAKGIDSNSGSDIKVYDSVSYNNGSYNLALYSNNGVTTDFTADGIVSYRSPIPGNDHITNIGEKIELSNQPDTISKSFSNYLWDKDLQQSQNVTGSTVTADWFEKLDTSAEPTRNENGSVNMNHLLVLTDQAVPGAGNNWTDDSKDTTLWVVGDSTVSAFSDKYYIPRYGWGTQLGNVLNSHVTIKNLALSGTSSKSFLSKKEYQTLLSGMKSGDYLMIGFGHNDEKISDETYTSGTGDDQTEGSFAKSLYDNYIQPAQKKGVGVILVTPLVRRSDTNDYTSKGGHVTETGDYVQSILDLGEKFSIPVCDLNQASIKRNTALDSDEDPANDSRFLQAQTSENEKTLDNTHTNLLGAAVNAYLIADELTKTDSGLKAYVKKNRENPMDSLDRWYQLSMNPNYEKPKYDMPETTSSTYAKGTDKQGNSWYGSVFGDVGEDATNTAKFVLGSSDGKIHISAGEGANTGKIAGSSDGIAMYYVRIPQSSTFSLKAKATIQDFNKSGKWANQMAFGLMARDDMYVDTQNKALMGDYVVAGVVQQSGKVYQTYARKGGALTYGGGTLASGPSTETPVSLEIASTGDGYAATYDGETVISGYDFALNAIDDEYVYVGMFAARAIDVTFEDIELTIDGKVQSNFDCYAAVPIMSSAETTSVQSPLKYADAELEGWEFAYFGTSTNATANTKVQGIAAGTDLSADNNGAVVKLTSCTPKADGSIGEKGGKFVAEDGYDGISYYYTTLDAVNDNFVLEATVTVDYINPSPDGQEGFALLARDSIGTHGVSDSAFFTNSMATIGTKLSYTDKEGVLHEGVKDIVGYRIFEGIKDTAVAPNKPLLYSGGLVDATDVSAVQIKQGGTYKLRLEETDSSYIMTYYEAGKSEGKSYTYYKETKDSDPLRTIDKDKQYVGFAVARGCNATFRDIRFTTSKADPDQWKERPITEVAPDYQITSASTSSGTYTLVFKANADGTAVIKADPAVGGKNVLAEHVAITANQPYSYPLTEKLTADTTFTVEFTPTSDYKPSKYEILSDYEKKTVSRTVSYRAFPTDSPVYVSASGTVDGTGAKTSPVDIATALKYAQPGQKIILAAETYKLDSGLKIERGIDGTADAPITVESADPAKHAILDFQHKGSGLEVWGSYWHFKNIDAANSTGKGTQVSGNHNVLEQMNFYNNGNTGLQISGTSAETIEMWPSYNTVKNCTSMNNADKAMEDADGFAAKLTCGVGNVFDGCIAAYNADDGWDLFAKVATGPIGDVTIKNSVAYRNGFLIVSEKNETPDNTEKPDTPKEVSLSLDKTKLTFDTIGATKTLTATVNPAGTSVEWSSSKTKVATVSGGTVKAVGNGTAIITAKAGNATATCTVTVSQKSKKVSLELNDQTVSGKTVTVTKGQTYKFQAVVTPSNTASKNKKVTWKSSNQKLATVSAKGSVKIKGSKGTVKITAATADKKKATVTLKISTKTVKVRSVKIDGKKTMKKGTKQTLKAFITPATAKNQKVSWKSSNKKIATVSSKGVVKALKKGKVKITVVTKEGNKKKTITIQVK